MPPSRQPPYRFAQPVSYFVVLVAVAVAVVSVSLAWLYLQLCRPQRKLCPKWRNGVVHFYGLPALTKQPNTAESQTRQSYIANGRIQLSSRVSGNTFMWPTENPSYFK